MKKFFMLLLMALCFSTLNLKAQTALTLEPASADYSSFEYDSGGQIWRLTGVAHNQVYTGLFFKIDITNNREGAFSFPKDITISGDFGTYHPVRLEVNDETFPLGKYWRYEGAKGKYVDVLLLFQRIPAGVSHINYTEPNFIRWRNIPVGDNPDPTEKTDWTEGKLRAHWDQNNCLPIEGIYYFTTTNSKEWWGDRKHTLAVIKDGYQYKIIYLRGSNPSIWKEGDVKATFVPTATRGLYKAMLWFMESKLNNEDFYLQFNEGNMSVYENTNNVTADFLKLYPAQDENLDPIPQQSGIQNSAPVVTSNSNPIATGSGIFIADKVLVTNDHVVSNAKKVEVIVKDGNKVSTYVGKKLSTDKTNDLALITIEDEKFTGIGQIPYALSTRTRDVGTSIFTMGYPLASYMGEEVKITDGIINSKTGYNGDIVTYQISAPIQPGSSGGPLFDKAGYLIGITNAGITQAQNVGYAIKGSYLSNLIESAPVNIAVPEANSIENLELTEQIKRLSRFVVFIKVY